MGWELRKAEGRLREWALERAYTHLPLPYAFAYTFQGQFGPRTVNSVTLTSQKSLMGYTGSENVAFIKIEIAEGKSLPKIRDEYLSYFGYRDCLGMEIFEYGHDGEGKEENHSSLQRLTCLPLPSFFLFFYVALKEVKSTFVIFSSLVRLLSVMRTSLIL